MPDDATNIWAEAPDWGGGVGAVRLVRAPGGSLNAAVWEFKPGASQLVYHFHHASQELLIVLRGSPTVRTPDGDRQLAAGDVLPFPAGPEGAHQLRNDGDSAARVVIVAVNVDPDVAEYPDTGKVAIVAGGRHRFHRIADAVDNAGPE